MVEAPIMSGTRPRAIDRWLNPSFRAGEYRPEGVLERYLYDNARAVFRWDA